MGAGLEQTDVDALQTTQGGLLNTLATQTQALVELDDVTVSLQQDVEVNAEAIVASKLILGAFCKSTYITSPV